VSFWEYIEGMDEAELIGSSFSLMVDAEVYAGIIICESLLSPSRSVRIFKDGSMHL
jgi:hypothetical protein